MKTLTVGEMKARFSEVLEEIKQGHPVAVGYGKKKTKVAVIVPYDQYQKGVRRLGVMEKRASYRVDGDFKVIDAELLGL